MSCCQECIDKANEAFQNRVEVGDFDNIVVMLNHSDKIDPSLHNNQALKVAVAKGYADIVYVLMLDSRVYNKIKGDW